MILDRKARHSRNFLSGIMLIPAFAGMLFLFTPAVFAAVNDMPDFADADQTTLDDIAAKARRAHDLAASDVIYQQEDFRALYYQNQQIIALLSELRDNLQDLRKQQTFKAEDKG